MEKEDVEVELLNVETLKESCVDVKDEITDFIKKNPLTSVALAAGIGFLIAKLLSGRKE